MTNRDEKVKEVSANKDMDKLSDEKTEALIKEEREARIRLIALEPTEIERIWEFYFLHAFNHPTPNEFYGSGPTSKEKESAEKEYIMRMFHQAIANYETLDLTHLWTEKLPGSSRVYIVGDLYGHFESTDKLLRFFMPKIFEAEATENPLRIIFTGNYIGGNSMDFHTLLYLLCFNILYPQKVTLLRGPNETRSQIQRIGLADFILEHFDEELLQMVYHFLSILPVARKFDSDYQPLFVSHGFLPIDPENPQQPLIIDQQELRTSVEEISQMNSIAQQLIYNQAGSRMKEDNLVQPVKSGNGYKINQILLTPILELNEIDIMVMSNITHQNGHQLYGNNSIIALFSVLEYNNEPIHGKFLEIEYPPDPEYPEYQYENDEEIDDESEEDESSIEESSRVLINLMDLEQL